MKHSGDKDLSRCLWSCSFALVRNDDTERFRVIAILCPLGHQAAPLVEQIPAPIRGLGRVADGVRERHFADFARVVRAFGCPIAEGAAKTMHGNIFAAHAPEERK